MSDTLSISGEVIAGASLIVIGLVIGAWILGFVAPFAEQMLVTAAMLVVAGIILMIYSIVAEGRKQA
ncbi:MAG: hypothetical protein QCH35_09560 [Methanomicrobiaceae archaeon]|nr:hypothetical protein [Methanomicrobiaceae archaeon]